MIKSRLFLHSIYNQPYKVRKCIGSQSTYVHVAHVSGFWMSDGPLLKVICILSQDLVVTAVT